MERQQEEVTMPVIHRIKYSQNTRDTKLWQANCSCWWSTAGERHRVIERADEHMQIAHSEWIEADPHEAVAEVVGG
jgi:hypothetical protein